MSDKLKTHGHFLIIYFLDNIILMLAWLKSPKRHFAVSFLKLQIKQVVQNMGLSKISTSSVPGFVLNEGEIHTQDVHELFKLLISL